MARAAVWLLVLVLVGCGGGRAEPPLATRLQRTLDRVRPLAAGGARRALELLQHQLTTARAGRRRLLVDAMLAILAVFVLHGTVARVTALAAMLVFIFACIAALRQPNADLGGRTDRTGLAGWIGHWF